MMKISLRIIAKVKTLKVKMYRIDYIKIKMLYAPGNIKYKIKSKQETGRNLAAQIADKG